MYAIGPTNYGPPGMSSSTGGLEPRGSRSNPHWLYTRAPPLCYPGVESFF